MTREELLDLGLTEEMAQAVLDAEKQTEVEKTELAAQLAQAQAQLALRDKRDAVLALLPGYGPKDAQLVIQLIDLERIVIDENGASGLEEQLRSLKKRAPYLFTDEPDPAGGTAASGMNPTEFDMNAFLRGEN